jgi:hypothetical protein
LHRLDRTSLSWRTYSITSSTRISIEQRALFISPFVGTLVGEVG